MDQEVFGWEYGSFGTGRRLYRKDQSRKRFKNDVHWRWKRSSSLHSHGERPNPCSKISQTDLGLSSGPTKKEDVLIPEEVSSLQIKHMIAKYFVHFFESAESNPFISERKNRKKRKGRLLAGGDGYKERWKIERCFVWIDKFRRIVVRYERYIQHDKALC